MFSLTYEDQIENKLSETNKPSNISSRQEIEHKKRRFKELAN